MRSCRLSPRRPGWVTNCARRTTIIPPNDPSKLARFSLRGAARLSFTARIEGAHSDRAASASKKDGLAVPLAPFHRGGSVSRGEQARPLLLFPPKPLIDKNNEGDGYALTAHVQRGPSEAARCVNGLSFLLPPPLTAAEATRTGRRAETEIAITGEGGTQLAADRDRCSS